MHDDACRFLFLDDLGKVRVQVVDWLLPVSTVVGAVVAMAATMLADRSRWKREQSRDQDQIRRESYGGYLAALVQAHDAMRTAAGRGGSSPDSRHAAITGVPVSRSLCAQIRAEPGGSG